MEKKEDLEIKKAPEELPEQDLENVTGGDCPFDLPWICRYEDDFCSQAV